MKPVLQTVWHTCGAHKLIVLLPGAYMKPDDFRAAGFFAAAARRRAPDIVAVDLDPGLISDGSALSLLDAEVIAPARRQGYAAIWLGGVSLGGLLALCYNADTPAGVDGLCLLAPYPGSRLTRNAITRAGGLEAWEPDCKQLDDPEFRMWRWLKRPPAAFPVFVGYGRDDRFADGMRQIAGCFPAASRLVVAGGHDWPVWLDLWENFLDRGYLAA